MVNITTKRYVLPKGSRLTINRFFLRRGAQRRNRTATSLHNTSTRMRHLRTQPIMTIFNLMALTIRPIIPNLKPQNVLRRRRFNRLNQIHRKIIQRTTKHARKSRLFTRRFRTLNTQPKTLTRMRHRINTTLRRIINFLLTTRIRIGLQVTRTPTLRT